MSPSLRLALALVRGWTRCYTLGMAPAARDGRRDEIESDLWEFHEDARRRRFSPGGIAVLMLMRLVLGAPDDLLWRMENLVFHFDIVRDALWAAAIGSVVALWLMMSALQTKEPPLSPVGAGNILRVLYPVNVFASRKPQSLPSDPAQVLVHVSYKLATPPPPPPPPDNYWR
jgi:hypothetical protein